MRLVGMLDSPYVRRVAISLERLGVPFVHEAKSVFTTFVEFQQINPVVKAPTLVLDDGTVLMDSTLILQYAESTLAHGHSLWPQNTSQLAAHFRMVSLALAACDKGVQLVYERSLRPETAQHLPWLERVGGQLTAALAGLEHMLAKADLTQQEPGHAAIASAVMWQFVQAQASPFFTLQSYPKLNALSQTMEASPLFKKYPPTGPGVVTSN